MKFCLSGLLGFIGVLSVSSAMAAPGQSKQKPKPKPKPPVTSPTKGTVQLAGDKGKIGITYQLGDKDYELHFNLISAEVAPFIKTPEDLLVAEADQRLLILTYSVQNPHPKQDMNLNWNTFKFTVVSPDDKNFTTSNYIYDPESLKRLTTDLKPAQKTKVVAVIPIYPSGPLHKLIVQKGTAPVLRYDLEGLIKKMKSSFSPDGLELANEAKVELGKPFDIAGLEVEVQEVKSNEDPVGNYKPSQDSIIYTAKVKYTNLLARPQNFSWTTIRTTLVDENGEEIGWLSDLVSIASGKTISQNVEPGESIRGFLVFQGSRKQKPAKLRLLNSSVKRTAVLKLSE